MSQVVTGGVRSNISSKTHYDLPEDSIYAPMRDLFYERRVGRSQSKLSIVPSMPKCKLRVICRKSMSYRSLRLESSIQITSEIAASADLGWEIQHANLARMDIRLAFRLGRPQSISGNADEF